jgi:hypothetical protein
MPGVAGDNAVTITNGATQSNSPRVRWYTLGSNLYRVISDN